MRVNELITGEIMLKIHSDAAVAVVTVVISERLHCHCIFSLSDFNKLITNT